MDKQATPAKPRPPQDRQGLKMPKWLFYGLIAKGVIVTLIVIGVLWYAGIFG